MATVIITFVKVSPAEAAERGRLLRHYLGLGALRASMNQGDGGEKVTSEGSEVAKERRDNVTLGGKNDHLGNG